MQKDLQEILYKVRLLEMHGSHAKTIKSVNFDSRKVEPEGVFVAVKGIATDGHNFIDNSIEKGAVAIICEEFPESFSDKITYVKVQNSANALGVIAANFYDNPSEKIRVVGVTGTNGKTTIATLLFRLFRKAGESAGILSTVQNQINDKIIEAKYTTPDPVQINQLLSKMVNESCRFAFMEVSSHAIHQQRIAGLHFDGGIFTNISHDHLDYHKTFKEYIHAKKMFFDSLPSKSFALINIDDKHGKVMIQNTKAKKFSYSLRKPSDFKGKVLENSFSGIMMEIDGEEFHSQLVGEFNAYNILAVYGAGCLLGMDKIDVLSYLSGLKAAEGRFDYFLSENEKIVGIIDYAHTPDALDKTLDAIGKVRRGDETLITIVGCGGDRDKDKRPEMAKIAAEKSDRVILTSDNPRSEDPGQIIRDMKAGIDAQYQNKVLEIESRKEAIRTACALANPSDIILVAGKGHEKYQEVNGVKHPFDDKKILSETFKEMNK